MSWKDVDEGEGGVSLLFANLKSSWAAILAWIKGAKRGGGGSTTRRTMRKESMWMKGQNL